MPVLQSCKSYTFAERVRFALAGWVEGFRGEANFRIQVLVALLLVPFMIWLKPAAVWWGMVAICTTLVLALELVNTALERVLDGLHSERAEFVRQAKDCAAGAVLMVSVGSVLVFISMIFASLGGK